MSAEPSAAAWAGVERFPLHGVAVDVRSLYNVGALFRASEAARVARLWLTGMTGHPGRNPAQIAKTALGAEHSVPWTWAPDPAPVLAGLRAQGVRLVALEVSPRAQPLHALTHDRFPLALVVGHETDGVPRAVLDACDEVVSIPTYGRKPSLNVALAYGVAVLHAARVFADG